MSQMTGFVVLVALAAGCGSKQSTAGWFVRDLRFEGHTLQLDRCRMDLDYQDDRGAQIAVCLFTIGLLCSSGSAERWTLTANDCTIDRSEIVGAQ